MAEDGEGEGKEGKREGGKEREKEELEEPMGKRRRLVCRSLERS